MNGASGFLDSLDSEASNQGRNYNDEQDKLGDQPKHTGLIDLPCGICEAVAGQGVSRSKHNDTSDEHGIKDRVRV